MFDLCNVEKIFDVGSHSMERFSRSGGAYFLHVLKEPFERRAPTQTRKARKSTTSANRQKMLRKNVEFIKEALAQTSCDDETLQWINATKNKLEVAMQTSQAKLPR